MKVLLASFLFFVFGPSVYGQNTSRFCMTVFDEFGAVIPNAIVKFMPRQKSNSQTKYRFTTDDAGNLDVAVIDALYNIEIHASSFKKLKLRRQILPLEPRTCIDVKLKSNVPPHQIT